MTTKEPMSTKEAVAILKSNYPSNHIMLKGAVDLAIKVLEGETVVHLRITSTDELLEELHRRIKGAVNNHE